MNNLGICSTQLFVAQISEQSISDKAMPCRFAGKKIFPASRAGEVFFFAKPCLENGLCSGAVVYQKDWSGAFAILAPHSSASFIFVVVPCFFQLIVQRFYFRNTGIFMYRL